MKGQKKCIYAFLMCMMMSVGVGCVVLRAQDLTLIKEVVETPESDVIKRSKHYPTSITPLTGFDWDVSNNAKPYTLIFKITLPSAENIKNYSTSKLIITFSDAFTREIGMQSCSGNSITFLLIRSIRNKPKPDDQDFYNHLKTSTISSIWITRGNDILNTSLINPAGTIAPSVNFKDLINSLKIE